MSSVKKNLTLQTLYQILSVCLPLITAPYLARVLGAEKLGIFSYTLSIVSYFTLFAILGTVNYGTRTIASIKDNLKVLSSTFWEIYALQFFCSIGLIGIYILYICFLCKANVSIAWIQGLTLLNCTLDISWFFFGLENFTITVTRSALVKFLTLILILLCIKTPDDLYLYTLIMAGSTVLSQAVLWWNIPTQIKFCKPTWTGIKLHIYPNLMLFFPRLAISIYHLMDKTMLGFLSTYEQTGFYYNADKLINIPLSILNGVGLVLLPHMTHLLQQKNIAQANKLFSLTLSGIAAISIAMAVGIAAIARDFVPFFFGPGYEPCIKLTYIFAPIFIIKSFSHISSTQFLIPRHLEKYLTISICLGAIINIICNILLIPSYGALGAVISTLAAEGISCIWQFKFITPVSLLKQPFLHTVVYLCIGMIMWFIIQAIQITTYPLFVSLLIKIVTGGLMYVGLCLLYWKITNNPLLIHTTQWLQDIGTKLEFITRK